VTDLLELGGQVQWTDADAAAAARAGARPGAGRLGELAEWLAATGGGYPPSPPRRARLVVLGEVAGRVADLAAQHEVGVLAGKLPADTAEGFGAGIELADAEIDAGADLLVLAATGAALATAAVVGLLSGAEPVALLPRGVAAIDSAAWIERAVQLRDLRRRVATLRAAPDDLLPALDSPELSVAAGVTLRTVARRTPLVLDGSVALAAALLCYDAQPRAGRWWQVADSSTDPVHIRAVEQLAQRPILDLGTDRGDGTAGVLAVGVLRAAAAVVEVGDE
jgi:nicotinate-nucleotide--dimethylbenzimidazole phosphoribosyltransferase